MQSLFILHFAQNIKAWKYLAGQDDEAEYPDPGQSSRPTKWKVLPILFWPSRENFKVHNHPIKAIEGLQHWWGTSYPAILVTTGGPIVQCKSVHTGIWDGVFSPDNSSPMYYPWKFMWQYSAILKQMIPSLMFTLHPSPPPWIPLNVPIIRQSWNESNYLYVHPTPIFNSMEQQHMHKTLQLP